MPVRSVVAGLLMGVLPLSACCQEQWIVASDLWGNRVYQTLTLERDHAQVSGRLDEDRVSGTLRGNALTLVATAKDGQQSRLHGRIHGTQMRGNSDLPDPNNSQARALHTFSAWRVPTRTDAAPRVHRFVPRDYSNTFSADRPPALVIWPGDSVRTQTLDSGGVDAHGITRALFGNPQVGPFFVVGAEPGDTLAITLVSLSLNRDYADSLDGLVGRLQTPRLASKAAGLGQRVRWRLDREAGIARPDVSTGPLQHFTIPVKPMLGGLALAPGFGYPPISTGDTASFGGNMDFNAVLAGNTVYLPVQQPGALLYLGDGHALQGDGETTQWALETSLDVEFRVALRKQRAYLTPRVESPTQVMALGQGGSSDDALRVATAGLLQWLQDEYGLSLSEATQVLGVAVHYQVANLAGRSVGVAAKLDKALLDPFASASSRSAVESAPMPAPAR